MSPLADEGFFIALFSDSVDLGYEKFAWFFEPHFRVG